MKDQNIYQRRRIFMETAELKQYLKDVYELHSQYYTYGEILNQCKNKIETRKKLSGNNSLEAIYEKLEGQKLNESTGYSYKITDFSDYKKYVERAKEIESYTAYENSKLGKLGDFLWKLGIFILFITIALPIIVIIYTFFTSGFWDALALAPLGLLFPFIGIGISNLFFFINDKIDKKFKNDTTIKKTPDIISKERKKANKHNAKTIEKLMNYHDSVVEPYNNVQNLLAELYNQNIIHPKYRSLTAISQFYEYFDTGRCTELEGPDGAYNLYENELRQNIIIDKMDIIISQLDTLNHTMGYMVACMNQTNMLLNSISSSLYKIEANTALTAYNTQCIANNTQIANRYGYTNY